MINIKRQIQRSMELQRDPSFLMKKVEYFRPHSVRGQSSVTIR